VAGVTYPITDDTHFDENNCLFSEQRLSIPRERLAPEVRLDTTLAYRLAAEYFAILERAWGPLIDVQIDAGEIDVVTRGRGLTLRFGVGVPEVSETRAAIRWPIVGGQALDKSADEGGTFTIGAEWDAPRANLIVFSRVENYPPSLTGRHAPRLRRFIYGLTQQRAHHFFTHRFLEEAARELTQTEAPTARRA
jgi:hypothetical protein